MPGNKGIDQKPSPQDQALQFQCCENFTVVTNDIRYGSKKTNVTLKISTVVANDTTTGRVSKASEPWNCPSKVAKLKHFFTETNKISQAKDVVLSPDKGAQ